MKITILGSGTCFPSLKRFSSSVWINHQGFNILLDAGGGCSKRLLEAGGKVEDLDAVFLSHFHIDHSAELVSILFSLKYGMVKDYKKNLFILGGKGLKEFYNGLENVYGHWIDLNGGLKFEEFDILLKNSLNIFDLEIEIYPVNHRPESLALKLKDKNGKVFVYSGDMDITPGFHLFCKDADILLIESATPDSLKKDGHITPGIAGEIAEKAGVKKLILTHFYPECDFVDMKKEAAKYFRGEIELAFDLMELVL